LLLLLLFWLSAIICSEQCDDDAYRELVDGRVLGTEQCFGYRLPVFGYMLLLLLLLWPFAIYLR
jgi:hypothetical protein